jgi:hypothetical protein
MIIMVWKGKQVHKYNITWQRITYEHPKWKIKKQINDVHNHELDFKGHVNDLYTL